MTWSRPQRIAFLKLCTLAEWGDATRYLAMRHVGCRVDRSTGNPSVKDQSNTQRQYELVMELAEAAARSIGVPMESIPTPKNHRTWADAARLGHSRQVEAIRAIAAEAIERLPGVFGTGFLDGFIRRMTFLEYAVPAEDFDRYTRGCLMLGTTRPTALSECDGGQLYRIHEGLKAWVGREMVRAGITAARTFEIPKHLTTKRKERVA